MNQTDNVSGDRAIAEKGAAWRNPWIWGMLGLGAAVLLANGVLVFYSLSTSPGLVVEDFYERGSSFPTRSHLGQKITEELGWDVRLIEPRGIKVGKPYRYEATVLGKDGRPVEADRVVMFVYRPSDAKQDFSVALKGEGEGRYWTNLVFSAPGIWDLFLEIENSEGTQEVVRRITVS